MFARTLSIALLVATLIGASACGDDPTGGTTPPSVLPPSVTCPANVSVSGAAGTGQAVAYPSPVTVDGTPVVTTICLPVSGSLFPVGATTVTCTAKDAINRTAVCAFTVTLASSHLGAMHFIAFGDSITAGENGDEPPPDGFAANFTPAPCAAMTSTLSAAQAVPGSPRPQFFDPSISYPAQLLGLLNARFPSQTFTIENEGHPSETAEDGQQRLIACFATGDRPDGLLLLEGINDIAADNEYAPTALEQQMIVGFLKADVSKALAAGVPFIFVSTILPVRTCPIDSGQDCRVGDYGDPTVPTAANASINQINAMLRAGIGGATIVDANSAFKAADPTVQSLIGVDGLHPTQAGYAVLAQTWMNAIVARVPIASLRRAPR